MGRKCTRSVNRHGSGKFMGQIHADDGSAYYTALKIRRQDAQAETTKVIRALGWEITTDYATLRKRLKP